PTRIAFMVSSRIDSKVVLDKHGAETLLGNGDMLYSNRGLDPVRVHGSYVSTAEIQEVVKHLREQGTPDYDLTIIENSTEDDTAMEDEPLDTKWDQALDIVSRDRIASISYLQRKLKIGYNRAARMVERMQFEGIVSPPNGTNQREVLISPPPDF
ncbi:DNA translocase FtsK, partial [Myxococcota bacterium]|nr:DNA translocase FtsK [Myxococcota bacterium]